MNKVDSGMNKSLVGLGVAAALLIGVGLILGGAFGHNFSLIVAGLGVFIAVPIGILKIIEVSQREIKPNVFTLVAKNKAEPSSCVLKPRYPLGSGRPFYVGGGENPYIPNPSEVRVFMDRNILQGHAQFGMEINNDEL